MTVKELKDILANVPDEADVRLDDETPIENCGYNATYEVFVLTRSE